MSTADEVGDLPLLGEPLPVELANTLYGADEVEMLTSPLVLRSWVREVGALDVLGTSGEASGAGLLRDVRRLRAAVRAVLVAVVDGQPLPAVAVASLNAVAARCPTVRLLEVRAGDRPVVRDRAIASGPSALLGTIAAATIELVGGPDASRLRRCSRPGCTMVFVQHHGRRRWCHESCGHRVRQAAYVRRRAGEPFARG